MRDEREKKKLCVELLLILPDSPASPPLLPPPVPLSSFASIQVFETPEAPISLLALSHSLSFAVETSRDSPSATKYHVVVFARTRRFIHSRLRVRDYRSLRLVRLVHLHHVASSYRINVFLATPVQFPRCRCLLLASPPLKLFTTYPFGNLFGKPFGKEALVIHSAFSTHVHT